MLRLPRSVYEAIRAHGEEDYPAESCGVLLGIADDGGWRIHTAVRASNACESQAETRYSIAPAELVKIERDARAIGLEIGGFYHSHPNHAAQWSPTDLAEAHWIGCSYVITAVADGKSGATQSFLLSGTTEENKYFEDEPIEIFST